MPSNLGESPRRGKYAEGEGKCALNKLCEFFRVASVLHAQDREKHFIFSTPLLPTPSSPWLQNWSGSISSDTLWVKSAEAGPFGKLTVVLFLWGNEF